MRRGVGVIVVLVVAAGFGFAARMLDVVDNTDSDRPAVTASDDTAEDSIARLVASDGSQQTVREQRKTAAELAVRNEDEQSNAAATEVDPTATRLAAEVQSRSVAQTNSAELDTARGLEQSVIGLGFPVSASILASCEFRNGMHPMHSCEPNKKLLEVMAKEPRNELWASSAEGAIRAWAEQEPGKYTIRALECRSSICFIETHSLLEGLHGVTYRFEKSSGLRAGFPIHGTETAADGSKVYVTLYPFVRK